MNLESAVRKLRGDARTFSLKLATSAAGIAGRRCLDRPHTLQKLRSLASLPDADGKVLIDSSSCDTTIDVLSSGVVRLDGKDCLDFDYGSRGALTGWTGPSLEVNDAAVIWSHRWMGYYHWMIDIAPKIAAIQARPGNETLVWMLPRSNHSYERETLELLQIDESKVIDTTGFKNVRIRRAHMVMLPGWFEIQKSAALLRERLLPHAGPAVGERIYLKRKGRRICRNEDEVVRHLSKKGFVMIEDVPRTVIEQIGLFSGARVIVAPHGAALSNLLWCSGECTVIECFAEGYCPPYYKNLAAFTGMRYASIGQTDDSHWTGVAGDIHIDLRKLDACMETLGIS